MKCFEKSLEIFMDLLVDVLILNLLLFGLLRRIE